MRTLPLLLILAGCGPGQIARGDDKPAEKKLTYTEQVEKFEATVAGLAATQGNTTSELEGVKNELRALKGEVAEVRSLLSVGSEISIEVPQLKSDAPPSAASSDQRITFQGKPIDVVAWLRRSVTTVDIRGDVDAHLRDHGLEGDFSRFSRSQKLQLHSVAHSYGVPLKSSAPRKVVVKAPAVVLPYSSNCANGNCQRPQYGYSTRSRLFGWRR